MTPPPIPPGWRKLDPNERTLIHDKLLTPKGEWIEIRESFHGIRADNFTTVIRKIK